MMQILQKVLQQSPTSIPLFLPDNFLEKGIFLIKKFNYEDFKKEINIVFKCRLFIHRQLVFEQNPQKTRSCRR